MTTLTFFEPTMTCFSDYTSGLIDLVDTISTFLITNSTITTILFADYHKGCSGEIYNSKSTIETAIGRSLTFTIVYLNSGETTDEYFYRLMNGTTIIRLQCTLCTETCSFAVFGFVTAIAMESFLTDHSFSLFQTIDLACA